MTSFQALYDPYTITDDCIIYTNKQHHVPGVHTFAHYLIKNALPSLDWHYHENSFEFSIATKGSLLFSTTTSSYKFSGGDVHVSFPNEIHGTNRIPITLGELYWFQLDISDPEHFLFMNTTAARDMIAKLNALPHHIIQTEASEIHPLLKKAFKQAQAGGNPQLIATYLQLFLHLIIESSNKEKFRLSPDIGRTLNYIMDNITTELSLEELASIANLSCSQYKQKFKKQLGVSPRYYINHQKIEYAKDLLLDGASVTATAMQLGFTTSSYFSTVFKKFTLYTPVEYAAKFGKAPKETIR